MDASVVMFIIQALLGVAGVVVLMVFNDVRATTKSTAKDLADYKVLVAEKYVSVEELKDAVGSINRTLEGYNTRLEQRLDRMETKLDKMRDGE